MANQSEDTNEQQLLAIDKVTLTPIVRRALDSKAAEVIDWHYRPILGGAQQNSKLYRFAGSGDIHGEIVQWTLILKIIRWHPTDDDPSGVIYWKREPLAYQSGYLDNLPGGLAAPRCFGVIEKLGESFWIWLEEITDFIGSQWTLSQYGLSARQLGQFNGAFLMGEPLPPWAWLRKGWLRAYVAQAAPGIAQLHSFREHPQVKRLYPPDLVEEVFRLWAERETFFNAFDRLPQTLVHGDAFRRNLFAQRTAEGHDRTVVIDWAFVGIGAIGEELVAPVATSIGFLEVDVTNARQLDQIAFDGYMEGLRDAGWKGDSRAVRFCYTAASALRYGLPIPSLDYVFDESQHPVMETLFGRPYGELLDYWAETTRFLFDLAHEAWELLKIFG